ncbi:MAG: hypothetical protein Fur0042_24450 [Cyanophyceae cyanobacterium]
MPRRIRPRVLVPGLLLALAIAAGTPHRTPAQTLIDPVEETGDAFFYEAQQAVFAHLLADLGSRDSGLTLDGTEVTIAPMISAYDWLLATWVVAGGDYTEGIAGQLLFQKRGGTWVYVAEGNYLENVDLLMEFGVPRSAAEALAAEVDL